MAATDRGSYCFGVCWCPHNSDCATGVWLETSVAIRNPSVPSKFKTLNIRYIAITDSLFFQNVSTANSRCTADY